MTKITEISTLEDVALIVCKALKDAGIDAVLTGGAVVSIYSENRYMSYDLDFISHGDAKKIETVMKEIGFTKGSSRHYEHPRSDYFVEFPTPPLAIGDMPVNKFEEIENERGYLKLLTPTHCVMDRLSACYHWNDRQCLEQALLVTERHPVNMAEIKRWSEAEGMMEKFLLFMERVKGN